jgi:ABC-type phosphate transport system permease subunit
MSRFAIQRLGIGLLVLVTIMVVIPIIAVIGVIIAQGLSAISTEFLFTAPRNGMREGGIWPAIVGTFLLTVGTAIFSVPLGVAVQSTSANTRATISSRAPFVWQSSISPACRRLCTGCLGWACSCWRWGSAHRSWLDR